MQSACCCRKAAFLRHGYEGAQLAYLHTDIASRRRPCFSLEVADLWAERAWAQAGAEAGLMAAAGNPDGGPAILPAQPPLMASGCQLVSGLARYGPVHKR